MKKKIFFNFYLALGFFALFLVFTYPLIFHFNSAIYGLPGDTYGPIWWFWVFKNHLVENNFLNIANAPFSVNLAEYVHQPTIEYPAKILLQFFSPVLVYNIFFILSFILSGIGFYYLTKYLLKTGFWLSFLAGAAFMLGSFRMFHAYQHFNMLMVELIPFYLLALFATIKKANFWYVVLAAILYILLAFENYYFAFFMGLLTILVVFWQMIFAFIKAKKIFFNNKAVGLACLYLIIVAGVLGVYVKRDFSQTPKSYVRESRELNFYSTRWQDYFLPSVDHPIFGAKTYNYITNHLHQSNLFEQTLYLTWTLLILAIFGFYYAVKKKNQTVLFFAFTAIVFGYLSRYPPQLFYDHFPMFRVYSRMGLIVYLSIIIIAIYGLNIIIQLIKNKAWKNVFYLLALTLLLFELINFPPTRLTYLNHVAGEKVYRILKNEPGDFIVVNFPFVRSDEERNLEYQIDQMFFQKKMVNGAPRDSAGEDQRRFNLWNIEDERHLDELKKIGVKYAIVHEDVYHQGRLPNALWRYYDPNYEKYPEEYKDGELPKINSDKLEFVASDSGVTLYRLK